MLCFFYGDPSLASLRLYIKPTKYMTWVSLNQSNFKFVSHDSANSENNWQCAKISTWNLQKCHCSPRLIFSCICLIINTQILKRSLQSKQIGFGKFPGKRQRPPVCLVLGLWQRMRAESRKCCPFVSPSCRRYNDPPPLDMHHIIFWPRGGGGGYSHRNAIRGCAAQMGRFLTKNP